MTKEPNKTTPLILFISIFKNGIPPINTPMPKAKPTAKPILFGKKEESCNILSGREACKKPKPMLCIMILSLFIRKQIIEIDHVLIKNTHWSILSEKNPPNDFPRSAKKPIVNNAL